MSEVLPKLMRTESENLKERKLLKSGMHQLLLVKGAEKIEYLSNALKEADEFIKSLLPENLTPSDLAALAEPMGLAVVLVKPERDAIFRGAEQLTPKACTSVSRDDAHKVYKAMIKAGRIKPKQAEKGKDDAQNHDKARL